MSSPLPDPTHRRWGSGWIGRLLLGLLIVVFSVIAGSQLLSPDPRVLQVVAAGVIVFLAFRTKSIDALAFAVLLLPFPKPTSYGNTNVAFAMLIFLVWLFRVSTKREAPPIRTGLDLPILGLIMAYALSFYEVEPEHLVAAWELFLNFLSYVLVLYLAVNIVKTSSDVQKVLGMQTLSCVLLCVLAVYEQGHPGAVIIPGWIQLGASEGMTDSIRVGSTFLDYELFGEYCALNLFVQMFLLTRATSTPRRWVLVGVILLTFYALFSTVTRGALISFIVGAVYLIWLSRRRLNFVKLVTVLSLAIGLTVTADFAVSHYANSSSVLERLFETKLENGVPDTRAGAWKMAGENIARKPIIGHGPYYATRRGVVAQIWPHNVYLFYAYIVGFVGLAFYLWILWRLWQATRPTARAFGDGTYLQGSTILVRILLFTFIIDQIKIDYLRNPRYSFFVWLLFGLIYAIARVARQERAGFQAGPAAEPEDRRFTPRVVGVGRIADRPVIQRVAATPAVPHP